MGLFLGVGLVFGWWGWWMTEGEYAKHRGVSLAYVQRMRREGNLVMIGDGVVDAAGSDALLDSVTHPLRGGKRPGGGRPRLDGKPTASSVADDSPNEDAPTPSNVLAISVKEAVRRERVAKARLAEIELGQQAKQLTRVDGVNRAVFTLVRQALNQLQGMSSRLSKSLAAETDAFKVSAMLDADVANICAEMRAAAAAMLDGSAQQDAGPEDNADEDAADDEEELIEP